MGRLQESGTGGGRRWKSNRYKFIPETPGVYILFNEGKRVYINQTSNLKKQIEEDKKSICFDSVSWYRADKEYGLGLVKRMKYIHRNELEEE